MKCLIRKASRYFNPKLSGWALLSREAVTIMSLFSALKQPFWEQDGEIKVDFQKIISVATKRGIFQPAFDAYGGLAGFLDYGPVMLGCVGVF